MTTKQRQAEAVSILREFIKPDTRVYTVLRGVSSSGMTRWLDLYVIHKGAPRRITFTAADAMEWTYDSKRDALKVGGCGMDMGFHAVYCLSRRLFPEGFGIEGKTTTGRRYTPKTKAAAARAVKRGVQFYGRNGDASGWDRDGGYSLRHEWM